MGVSNKKSFRLHDKNIAPLCTSEIVLLNHILDSKRGAVGDATSSRYSIISPPTINMTLKGSEFSVR